MPNIMDIFHSDPFSAVALTTEINKTPFLPTFLSDSGIFDAVGVPTVDVALEVEKSKFRILDVSARGAPPTEETLPKATLGSVRTRQIAQKITIWASQLQGVSAMPGSQQPKALAELVSRGLAQMRNNIAATYEQSYLACIQGKWINNGNTIQDWYAYWQQSQASEIDFALDTDTTDVLGKCEEVITAMITTSEGLIPEGTQINCLCGGTFFTKLRDHPKVRETFMGYAAAASLREGNVFGSFPFGDILFKHYRGTNDGSSIAIAADKAAFYPASTNNLFKVFYAPHDSFDTVNTVGIPLYVVPTFDRDYNKWVSYTMFTYPLVACLEPVALQRAKAA